MASLKNPSETSFAISRFIVINHSWVASKLAACTTLWFKLVLLSQKKKKLVLAWVGL